MPHQCLKCGKVFPSGSPEILKGCNECGGKRFFYTEQAVSDQEREHLIEQANKDIKVLIREILSQSQHDLIKSYDSEGNEVPSAGAGKSDWVKVTPKGTVTADDAGKTVDKDAGEQSGQAHAAVKDILKELKSKPELGIEEGLEPTLEQDAVSGKEDLEQKKKGKVKLKRKSKPGKKKRKPRPEIITVSEPGVYDIQLEKLMAGFPIIINRDGTYLVHLPSVFHSMGKQRKK